jgi:hypothetical protein
MGRVKEFENQEQKSKRTKEQKNKRTKEQTPKFLGSLVRPGGTGSLVPDHKERCNAAAIDRMCAEF